MTRGVLLGRPEGTELGVDAKIGAGAALVAAGSPSAHALLALADRCDGTLTHEGTDSVVVNDFVHHKTIVLHAGQSYLAKKP